MSLEILFVHDQGDHEMEHVLLKAKSDCSIGQYLLTDGRHADETQAPNRVRQAYWFPAAEIKAGEYISLWTKRGKNTTDAMIDGTAIHRYYWNLPESLWKAAGECALLFHLRTWQCFRVREN
jgi:hypothetical protein